MIFSTHLIKCALYGCSLLERMRWPYSAAALCHSVLALALTHDDVTPACTQLLHIPNFSTITYTLLCNFIDNSMVLLMKCRWNYCIPMQYNMFLQHLFPCYLCKPPALLLEIIARIQKMGLLWQSTILDINKHKWHMPRHWSADPTWCNKTKTYG